MESELLNYSTLRANFPQMCLPLAKHGRPVFLTVQTPLLLICQGILPRFKRLQCLQNDNANSRHTEMECLLETGTS